MEDWNKVAVSPKDTILHAIGVIDRGAIQIAIVVDHDGRLLGTITDGDVRRGILKGCTLQDAVSKIMHPNPTTLPDTSSESDVRQLLREKNLLHVIMLSKEGRVTRIAGLSEKLAPKRLPNKVILMAGGLGTRLMPLTKDYPKPMLVVGKQPILQTIIESFKDYGLCDITLCLNYKSEIIKDFCGDGKRFGVDISYIQEEKRLGTAGALSLLPEKPEVPVIVMNADVMTTVNFKSLLEFHGQNDALATMALKEYVFSVPYGVAKIEGERLMGLVEKPQQTFFISSGIYVLSPQAVSLVPKDTFYDMPELFNAMLKDQKKVSVFLFKEHWIDIGQTQELERANSDYNKMFSKGEAQ
jgi:dTDP-glucose pyrophosphorylase